MRVSRQRQVIRNILKNTTEHPDADWVYREARKIMPNISLGTVYRNLRLLKETGELISIDVEQGAVRFDGDIADHSHFFCTSCGKIIDLDLKNVRFDELKEQGFEIHSTKIMIYGVCNSCKNKCGQQNESNIT